MKSVSLTVSQIERLTAESVKISFEIPQKDRFRLIFCRTVCSPATGDKWRAGKACLFYLFVAI